MGGKRETDRTLVSRLLSPSILVVLLVTAIVASVVVVRQTIASPKIHLLIPEGGAEWIRTADRVVLDTRIQEMNAGVFRTHFEAPAPVPPATLYVRLFKMGAVYLDGKLLWYTEEDWNWKTRYEIDLSPHLTPGKHELMILARHRFGRPSALAYAPDLGIVTGTHWETSDDKVTWTPVMTVSQYHPARVTNDFLRADAAVLRLAPLYAAILLAVAGLCVWGHRIPRVDRVRLSPSAFRFVVLGLLFLLAINNGPRLNTFQGYDQRWHYEYIVRLADEWRIPLANEGWQMFQSPLYYIVCVPLHYFFRLFLDDDALVKSMRVIPLASGILLAEMCYRASRAVFPQRADLQRIGTLIGGLMPMSLYLSQYNNNEPFASALIAVALVLCLTAIASCAVLERKRLVLVGGAVGLAFLAKFTAVLLFPITGAMVGMAALAQSPRAGEAIKRAAVGTGLVWGLAVVLSGWYYVRNWWYLGKPFIGGWDPVRGIIWWQDPGYRTPEFFTQFGLSLTRPIYASVSTFADGFYTTLWGDGMLSSIARLDLAPPWNYDFMLSGMWLALLPSVAMVLGVVRGIVRFRHADNAPLLFSIFVVGTFLAALVYHVLENPALCAVKAFYTLGALPCYAVIAAAGFDWILAWKPARPLVYGLLVCWAVAAYATYFAVK